MTISFSAANPLAPQQSPARNKSTAAPASNAPARFGSNTDDLAPTKKKEVSPNKLNPKALWTSIVLLLGASAAAFSQTSPGMSLLGLQDEAENHQIACAELLPEDTVALIEENIEQETEAANSPAQKIQQREMEKIREKLGYESEPNMSDAAACEVLLQIAALSDQAGKPVIREPKATTLYAVQDTILPFFFDELLGYEITHNYKFSELVQLNAINISLLKMGDHTPAGFLAPNPVGNLHPILDGRPKVLGGVDIHCSQRQMAAK